MSTDGAESDPRSAVIGVEVEVAILMRVDRTRELYNKKTRENNRKVEKNMQSRLSFKMDNRQIKTLELESRIKYFNRINYYKD